MLQAKDLLYSEWDSIPLKKLKLILQVLPLIRWDVHTSASNTYLKNFLLKQLFKSRKIFLLTTPEQRVDLFTHETAWIQEFSTVFPIKAFNLSGHLFQAPQTSLSDISVERLMEADIALYRFVRSDRAQYLGHFLAMLYTVKGEPLTDETIDRNTTLLQKIPSHEAVSIIRSFIGSFQLLRKQCPTLFPVIAIRHGGEQSVDQQTATPRSSSRGDDPAQSWQKLLFELANTPGYPGMESAKKALAWEALPYMDHEQSKIQREIERLNSSRNK